MGQDRGRLKKAKAALTPSFLPACMSDQLFHRMEYSFIQYGSPVLHISLHPLPRFAQPQDYKCV